jgi:predicted DNA-binding ribbon-helix-helix protein
MMLVYYYLDLGLAIGFITALVIEIFFLMTFYNVLKNTEEKVKNSYERILAEMREKDKKKENYISKIREIYPDVDLKIEAREKEGEVESSAEE